MIAFVTDIFKVKEATLHYMPPLNAIKKLKRIKSLIRENIAGGVNIGNVGISKAE